MVTIAQLELLRIEEGRSGRKSFLIGREQEINGTAQLRQEIKQDVDTQPIVQLGRKHNWAS